MEWRALAAQVSAPAVALEAFVLAPTEQTKYALPGGGGGALPGSVAIGERIRVPEVETGELGGEAARAAAVQRALAIEAGVEPARRGQLPVPERCAGVVVVGAATVRGRVRALRRQVEGSDLGSGRGSEGSGEGSGEEGGDVAAAEGRHSHAAAQSDAAPGSSPGAGELSQGTLLAPKGKKKAAAAQRPPLRSWSQRNLNAARPAADALPELMPAAGAFGLSHDAGSIAAKVQPRAGKGAPLGGGAIREQAQCAPEGGELLAPSMAAVLPHAPAAAMSGADRFRADTNKEALDERPLGADSDAALATRRRQPTAAFSKAPRFSLAASADDAADAAAVAPEVSYAAVEPSKAAPSFGKPTKAGRTDAWMGAMDTTLTEEVLSRRAEAELERDVTAADAAIRRCMQGVTFSSTPRFAAEPSESDVSVSDSDLSSTAPSPVSTLDAWNRSARAIKPRVTGGVILPEGRSRAKTAAGTSVGSARPSLNPNYDAIKRRAGGPKMALPSSKPAAAAATVRRPRPAPGPGQYDYSTAIELTKPRAPGTAWSAMGGRADQFVTPAGSVDGSLDGSIGSLAPSPVSTLDAARALDTIKPRVKGGVMLVGRRGAAPAKAQTQQADVDAPPVHKASFALVERRVAGGSWGRPPPRKQRKGRREARAGSDSDLSSDSRAAALASIQAADALLRSLLPVPDINLTRPSHPAWTFPRATAPPDNRLHKPPWPKRWLFVDDSLVRPRAPAFAFLSEARAFLKSPKPSNPREPAPGRYHDGIERAWARLERSVPSALFGAAAERWVRSGWAGGAMGRAAGDGQDEGPSELSFEQLEAAVRTTLPGAPRWSFLPVAGATWQQRHGINPRHLDALEGTRLWLDITPGIILTKRRTAAPVFIGAAQPRFPSRSSKSRKARLVRMEKAELNRYNVEPALRVVEPRVKGGAFGTAPREIARDVEESEAEETVIDVMRALGAVLPHHGTAVDMAATDGARSGDVRPLTADIDWLDDSALDAARVRMPAVDFAAGANRWSDAETSIEDFRVGPGVYFDGVERLFAIATAAERGRGPTFASAPTGRGPPAAAVSLAEGDVIRLDIGAADAQHFPSAPSAVIGDPRGPATALAISQAGELSQLVTAREGAAPPPGAYDPDIAPTRRSLVVSVPQWALETLARLPSQPKALYRDTPLSAVDLTALSEHQAARAADFSSAPERFVDAKVAPRAVAEGDRLNLDLDDGALRGDAKNAAPQFALAVGRDEAAADGANAAHDLDYADGAARGEQFLRPHLAGPVPIAQQRPFGYFELGPDPYGHDTLDGGSYDVSYAAVDKAVPLAVDMAADALKRSALPVPSKEGDAPTPGDALDLDAAAARIAMLPSAPKVGFADSVARDRTETYVDPDEGNTLILQVPAAASGRLLRTEPPRVTFAKQLPREDMWIAGVDESEGNAVLNPLDPEAAREHTLARRFRGAVAMRQQTGRPAEALLPDERPMYGGGGAFGTGGGGEHDVTRPAPAPVPDFGAQAARRNLHEEVARRAMQGGDALLLSPRRPEAAPQGFRHGRGANDFTAMTGRPTEALPSAPNTLPPPALEGEGFARGDLAALEARGPAAPGADVPAMPRDPLRGVSRAVPTPAFDSQALRRDPFPGSDADAGGAVAPSSGMASRAGSRARAMLDRYRQNISRRQGVLPTMRFGDENAAAR